MAPAPWLSVVIPCWNDAEALDRALQSFGAAAPSGEAEIIVADASAGQECRTTAVARNAIVVPCERPNRGAQMNAGASRAAGGWLLFHHADTEFTPAHFGALRDVRDRTEVLGGAFHRKFDERHPRLRWLERFHRTMGTHLGATIYGDQSFYVRREHFARLGGFADYPLMEDMEFSKRLRRAGGVHLLDPPIATSARRSQKNGAWRTSMQNGAFIVLFKLGVSPVRLHRWYYALK